MGRLTSLHTIEGYMFSFLLAQVFALVRDGFTLHRQSEREKDIEILLLHQQLRFVEWKQCCSRWTMQDRPAPICFLRHDRDTKFSPAFEAVFVSNYNRALAASTDSVCSYFFFVGGTNLPTQYLEWSDSITIERLLSICVDDFAVLYRL